MGKPDKKDPKKENSAQDFLSRAGGDFSLDDTDDSPAAVFHKKARPPQKPAADNKPPAEDKPGLYDFVPYRGNRQMPVGFDPDSVDDIDYNGIYGDDDPDDDDDDPRLDDPLFRIAARLLPERPEILNTLDVISNVDLDSLIAAGIIEEELRGHLPDKQVDRLTAAALLAGAENAYEVIEEVSKKTAELMVDFNMVAAAENLPADEFSRLAPDIQRLILAFNAADMEELSKGLRNGTAFVPDEDALAGLADFLAKTTQNRSAANSTEGDDRLMKRAARAFNEVSDQLPLEIELRPSGEKGLAVYNKNAIDAPEVGRIKRPNTPRNQPKPPKH